MRTPTADIDPAAQEHERDVTLPTEEERLAAEENASCWTRFTQMTRRLLECSQYTLGVLLILCVTVIWVASSNWIQYIFGNLDYEKPYFLTYFNTTGFTFWNLGFLFCSPWRRSHWDDRKRAQPIFVEDPDLWENGSVKKELAAPTEPVDDSDLMAEELGVIGNPVGTVDDGTVPVASVFDYPCAADGKNFVIPFASVRAPPLPDASAPVKGTYTVTTSNSDFLASPCSSVSMERSDGDAPRLRVNRIRRYSLRRIWTCALMFCPCWFLANYLFNVSLSITSVTSNTVLSSTSSIWTLLVSFLLLGQPIGPIKVLSVGLCVGGSIMVGLSDHSNSDDNELIIGDILALISAMCYAAYTSVLKWSLPEDARYAMGMAFGAVGVLNFCILWPGLLIVHYVDFEPFAWPTPGQLWPLVLNALIGTNLSDVLWARSVVLTSPVVATLGLALTTPLSMVVDATFKGATFPAQYICGALMVMSGFILVNLPIKERWPWQKRRE